MTNTSSKYAFCAPQAQPFHGYLQRNAEAMQLSVAGRVQTPLPVLFLEAACVALARAASVFPRHFRKRHVSRILAAYL